ncbi:hypothetical protein FE697_008210 [Mumia zhuanghuii]|uniref:HEPN domain-containing protein n=2 Tax=Mumia TaxID=1546255 RepID=A0ABW1QLB0_9ACTN|nr:MULTISPECIES: HEPN domain-containing protein [Mumia]KAA1423571.1 hypothetical protein FE697_008210 [Mumia zhuanghuii]
MPNVLEPDSARVGFCWDRGLPDGYPAMLRNTGREIELVVPHFREDDVHRRRFAGRGVSFGDDPDYKLHDYEVPEVVWFADTHGHLCLLDPYRSRTTLGGGLEEGGAYFRFAVAAGRKGIDYTRINGMHTRLQGLNEWTRLGSVDHEVTRHDRGRRTAVYLQAPQPLNISPRLNARLEGWHSWSLADRSQAGVSMIADGVRVSTNVLRPRTWAEHLDVHNAIRQLLTVAGWQAYGFEHVEVQSRRDPERALDDHPVWDRWAPVYTHDLQAPGDVERSRYLFEFDDIGEAGVRRWFKLRERHTRGIAGMIHSVSSPDAALETLFSEAAAAMEDIGYNIAVERGDVPGKQIREHLRRIVDEIDVDLGFDLNTWRLDVADKYRMVKHPEHPDVDSLDLLNLLRETRLLFRVWVARRLGTTKKVIERNLRLVPMRRPYVRL